MGGTWIGTTAELKRRGWTDALIKALLPSARIVSATKLYDGTYKEADIIKAEKAPAFQRRLQDLKKQVLEGKVDPINEIGKELRRALAGGSLTQQQDELLLLSGWPALGPAARILYYRHESRLGRR
jgi:hypothetical protein